MKEHKIKRFNENSELNISDVMDNVLSKLNKELYDINEIVNRMKYNEENWYFTKGKIKGLESSIKIFENILKHYS